MTSQLSLYLWVNKSPALCLDRNVNVEPNSCLTSDKFSPWLDPSQWFRTFIFYLMLSMLKSTILLGSVQSFWTSERVFFKWWWKCLFLLQGKVSSRECAVMWSPFSSVKCFDLSFFILSDIFLSIALYVFMTTYSLWSNGYFFGPFIIFPSVSASFCWSPKDVQYSQPSYYSRHIGFIPNAQWITMCHVCVDIKLNKTLLNPWR